MRYFSAQYVYTNSSAPLKRPVITTDNNGTIVDIEDTGGNLKERHSVEFYNGIIIPGFVNCHAHLELSHMSGKTSESKGLPDFISEIRNNRETDGEIILKAIKQSDSEMFNGGIVLCGDICNSASTFEFKGSAQVSYVNFLEIFGADSSKAGKRFAEITDLAAEALKNGLSFNIVPHSVYSVSEPLFRLIKNVTSHNNVSSIHFMESESERVLLETHSGELIDSYIKFGIPEYQIDTVRSHADAILNRMTLSGTLLLVHNTFVRKDDIKALRQRKNLYWCLCPQSNLFIENQLPPVDILIEENCDIVLGTDSKGSNSKLSILSEIVTLQKNFETVSAEMVIKWATINGAKALGADSWAGSIETGKKPGLVLIENFDFEKNRFTEQSSAKRLI